MTPAAVPGTPGITQGFRSAGLPVPNTPSHSQLNQRVSATASEALVSQQVALIPQPSIFSDGTTAKSRYAPRKVKGTGEKLPVPMTPAVTPAHWTAPKVGEAAKKVHDPVPTFDRWRKETKNGKIKPTPISVTSSTPAPQWRSASAPQTPAPSFTTDSQMLASRAATRASDPPANPPSAGHQPQPVKDEFNEEVDEHLFEDPELEAAGKAGTAAKAEEEEDEDDWLRACEAEGAEADAGADAAADAVANVAVCDATARGSDAPPDFPPRDEDALFGEPDFVLGVPNGTTLPSADSLVPRDGSQAVAAVAPGGDLMPKGAETPHVPAALVGEEMGRATYMQVKGESIEEPNMECEL